MLPLQQFTDHVQRHQLFAASNHVLLAVSGGKDSALMVQLFKLAGYHFSIAHCNFNLRADEAQRDETFVKLLAEELEVPFHVAHFDTKAYAENHKISIQMAARDLRYQWFEELRQQHHYHCIATAHHQNDSIETLLLNLVRGTGISGLHGIQPKRGNLVRPMLFLSRQQIHQLVDENHIAYVEDSSNQSDKYARNKIRLHVVPQLKELNPNLEETFAQNIERFVETELALQQMVAQIRQKLLREVDGAMVLSVDEVQALVPQKLLLVELLKPYNFTSVVVAEVLASLRKQSGTSFYSPTHRLTVNRQQLLITPVAKNEAVLFNIHGEGTVMLAHQTQLNLSFSTSVTFERSKNKAYVDAELLIFPLVVRYKQAGDQLMPLGMKSFKKLSDFFIDEKISIPEKEKTPLLINGNGEIIWVGRLRQDERYKVSATTKKVAIFELSNK
jgi:tRNA(Ile)-lysidine synthase